VMDLTILLGLIFWQGLVAVLTWYGIRRMPQTEDASEDYFAGGRSLKWYIVSGSLMLTNLSAEQLVGLNGNVFTDGCLVNIWWEAGACIAIMLTASLFLPRYMQLGVITTTSFIGERYDRMLRSWMSMAYVLNISLLVGPTVLYNGAIGIQRLLDRTDLPVAYFTTAIGLLGAIYAVGGGLKAVAVSDCFNGLGLLVAGMWVPLAAISMLPNGLNDLFDHPENLQVWTDTCPVWDQTTRIRADTRPSMPWDIIPLGATIKNLEYWAMSQFIVQRALAAESLAHGQKGVLFAALMKVIGFAFLCMPGILAVVFVRLGIQDGNGNPFEIGEIADQIFPAMVDFVMPAWTKGVFMGILLGSVLSTFNSALNSASTMFALEIYKPYINTEASQESLVRVGSFFGVFLTLASFFLAPQFSEFEAIFKALQLYGTFVAVPAFSVFFVGILTTLPDALAAKSGFIVGAVCVILMQFLERDGAVFYGFEPPAYATLHYLHIMTLSFLLAMEVTAIMTYSPMLRQLFGGTGTPTPYVQKSKPAVDQTPFASLHLIILGISVALTTLLSVLQLSSVVGFYVFWLLWFVVAILLLWAPVPDAVPVDGKAGPQGAGSFLLSLRTNTYSRSSIVAAQI